MSETLTIKGRFQTLLAPLAQMVSLNPVLLSGESWTEQSASTGFSTGRRKIGDGVTAFNALPFEPTIGDHLAAIDPHPQYEPLLTGPVATYDSTGRLTRIDYDGGYAKLFGVNAELLLTTLDFLRPGRPTLRKTLTWANGQWQRTSTPEVI
jgi:hypothetical protein